MKNVFFRAPSLPCLRPRSRRQEDPRKELEFFDVMKDDVTSGMTCSCWCVGYRDVRRVSGEVNHTKTDGTLGDAVENYCMCNVYKTVVLVFVLLFSSGALLLIPPLYVSMRHHLYNLTVC